MTETAEKLKTELAQLPESDRAELVRYLIESLDDGCDPDAEAAWDAELQRRAAQILGGTAQGQPAADALAQLREKYS